MPEMKDSGIEWVGLIPSHWEIIRVKDKYMFDTGFTPDTKRQEYYSDDNGYEWATIADINNGVVASPTKSLISRNYVNTMHVIPVPSGCLLYSFKLSVGQVALTDRSLFTNEALAAFVPNEDICIDFLKYSSSLIEYNSNTNIYGAKILNQQLINSAYIVFPPLEEQILIAKFLDEKCSEIDTLIADIQSEIDTLEEYKKSVITEAVTKGLNPDVEMKDSGIFYMAPFNAEWRLTKIGYECIKLERTFNPEDMALICSNKGKILPRPDEMTGKMVSEDNAMQGIKIGDIAIHGMDTWHGAIAVSDYEGKVTRVVHVCQSNQNNSFIVYYLKHLAYMGVYKLISNGVRGNTSDFRSWDKVKDIYIALPSLNEQDRIVQYLDTICYNVEKICSQKKEQIEALEEYKKSLIYEYVTGKKEVPVE